MKQIRPLLAPYLSFCPFLWMSNTGSFDFWEHSAQQLFGKFITVLEIAERKKRFRGRPLISLSGPFNKILLVAYCSEHHSDHLLFYFAVWR